MKLNISQNQTFFQNWISRTENKKAQSKPDKPDRNQKKSRQKLCRDKLCLDRQGSRVYTAGMGLLFRPPILTRFELLSRVFAHRKSKVGSPNNGVFPKIVFFIVIDLFPPPHPSHPSPLP
jgi:hypothetical protein